MKENFKSVFQTKMFDAALGILLFMILAFALDYATDEQFTSNSILFDLVFSFLLGVLLVVKPSGKKMDPKILKQRAETMELVGKVLIGILLFVTLIVLILTK